MSKENVELFKKGIERFNRGDSRACFATTTRRFSSSTASVELQVDVTGIDAVRDWFVGAAQIFDPWTVDCDDIRDLGDRVLALGTVRAVGKESGVEVEMPFTVLATVQDGLVTHFTDYGDREKALEAAGLRE